MNPTVRDSLVSQMGWYHSMRSPLYAEILRIAIDDFDQQGPVYEVLADYEGDAVRDMLANRIMGGVHRLVLQGRAEGLAKHFPTVGGTPDGETLAADFLTAVHAHVPYLRDALTVPPQTNEIGRSNALFPGLAVALRGEDRPVRLLEIGSSAGLNLMLDRYSYRTDVWSWEGTEGAPVLEPIWTGPAPAMPSAVDIVSRQGCDASPMDVLDPEARERLLSFVWADQLDRYERVKKAIDLVTPDSFTLVQEDAGVWLADRLAEPVPDGVLTVVQHSVMWQYVAPQTQRLIESIFDGAANQATSSRPFAHVAYEPTVPMKPGRAMQLTVDRWPDGPHGVYAYGHAHGSQVEWLGIGPVQSSDPSPR